MRHFASLPIGLRLSGAAVVLMALGTFLPWHRAEVPEDAYLLGIHTIEGALTVGLAVVAGFLIGPLLRVRKVVDSGGVAAIGLLASGLVATAWISPSLRDFVSPSWGLYVSAGAALLLFIGGVWLLAGPTPERSADQRAPGGEPLGPPD